MLKDHTRRDRLRSIGFLLSEMASIAHKQKPYYGIDPAKLAALLAEATRLVTVWQGAIAENDMTIGETFPAAVRRFMGEHTDFEDCPVGQAMMSLVVDAEMLLDVEIGGAVSPPILEDDYRRLERRVGNLLAEVESVALERTDYYVCEGEKLSEALAWCRQSLEEWRHELHCRRLSPNPSWGSLCRVLCDYGEEYGDFVRTPLGSAIAWVGSEIDELREGVER